MKEDINLNISNKIFPFFTQFESSLEKKKKRKFFLFLSITIIIKCSRTYNNYK